jgi:hypothetical protein
VHAQFVPAPAWIVHRHPARSKLDIGKKAKKYWRGWVVASRMSVNVGLFGVGLGTF